MVEPVVVSEEIEAPSQVAWELVSDVTRMGEWSPETTSCSWRGGATGPAVGAKFSGSNRLGWRRWSTMNTVVECEPGRSFVFETNSGPFSVARWGYRFEETEGGCRVTETWDDRRTDLMAKITGVVVGVSDRATHNRASMTTTLERLKVAAEAKARA